MIRVTSIISPRFGLIYVPRGNRDRLVNRLSCGTIDVIDESMITRVNFFGRGFRSRFRHSATPMHFVVRPLPSLTRCKPVQYAQKRGLHALQNAPGLKSRLRASLKIPLPDGLPYVCRRTIHASFGEILFAQS